MISKRIEEGLHKGWNSRNIESYPEKFFNKVLKNNNIFKDCEKEYMIKKKDLGIDCNSNYFIDYYFPNKRLALEIDGQQHEIKERKESDNLRDEYLNNNGIGVYRIKWKDINTKPGKEYMKEEIDKFLQYYNNL